MARRADKLLVNPAISSSGGSGSKSDETQQDDQRARSSFFADPPAPKTAKSTLPLSWLSSGFFRNISSRNGSAFKWALAVSQESKRDQLGSETSKSTDNDFARPVTLRAGQSDTLRSVPEQGCCKYSARTADAALTGYGSSQPHAEPTESSTNVDPVLYNTSLGERKCDQSQSEPQGRRTAAEVPWKLSDFREGRAFLEALAGGDLEVAAAALESPERVWAFEELAIAAALVHVAKNGNSDTFFRLVGVMLGKYSSEQVTKVLSSAFHSAAMEIRGPEDDKLLNVLSMLLQHGASPASKDLVFLSRNVEIGRLDDCFFQAVSSARNCFIPGLNISFALQGAMDDTREIERKILACLRQKGDAIMEEVLRWLPQTVGGVPGGMEVCTALFEPEIIDSRAAGDTGPLSRTLGCVHRIVTFATAPLGMDYMFQKFTRGLPGLTNASHVLALETPRLDLRDEGKGHEILTALTPGSTMRSILIGVGEIMSDRSLSSLTIFPGAHFITTGIVAVPNSYYNVPAVRMAMEIIVYSTVLVLFTKEVLLFEEGPPAAGEFAFFGFVVAAIIAEVIEIARDSNEYMLDRWSVLDFVAFQCCLAAFIFRLVDAESSWGQSLYAVAAPLLFWRLLFYAQILPFQGAMVQVIFTMATELAQFAVIMGVVMIGFAVSFFSLFREVRDVSFRESWLDVFKAMLGEIGVFGDFSNTRFDNVASFLLIVYLIIMSIILLNLLIAVLSTVHSSVEENILLRVTKARLYKYYRWVVQSDSLPPPFNLLQLAVVLPLKLFDFAFKSKTNTCATRVVGRVTFWLVMGPIAVFGGSLLWWVSMPKAVAIAWSTPVAGPPSMASKVGRSFICVMWCTVGVPICLTYSWLAQVVSVIDGSVRALEAAHPRRPFKISVDVMLKEATGGKGIADLRRFVKDPLTNAGSCLNNQNRTLTIEHLQLLQEHLEATVTKRIEELDTSLEEKMVNITGKTIDARISQLEEKVDNLLARLLPNGVGAKY